MEETTNMLDFDQPKEQSSYIKVIGVGGGGGNAVKYMYEQGIKGVDFIVCNTDLKALNTSPVPNKITLGKGLGAGNKPERAKAAAEQQADEIREMLSHNTQMLFITAGMGGGTGTGAAPVIAEIAKSINTDNEDTKKILVVAIVTTPFSYEGPIRKRQAEAGIAELRKHVDSILVISNDKIRCAFGNMGLSQALNKANTVLHTAAKGIAEIITGNGFINIDFEDVNTVMESSGTALMGTGSGKGDNRAIDAIVAASNSYLLNDNEITGAQNMLLYYSYSPEHEMTMDEMTAVTDYLREITGDSETNVIWGAGEDETLEDELRITLIATGFEQNEKKPFDGIIDNSNAQRELSTNTTTQTTVAKTQVFTPQPVTDLPRELEPKVVPPENATPQAQPKPEPHIYVLNDDPVLEDYNKKQTLNTVKTNEEVKHNDIPASLEPKIVGNNPETHASDTTNHTAQKPNIFSDPFQSSNNENNWRNNNTVYNDSNPETITANLTKDRAQRIKIMHDLLRTKSDGAQIIENMSTEQLSSEAIYETPSSRESETPRNMMASNGVIVSANNFLYDQPD